MFSKPSIFTSLLFLAALGVPAQTKINPANQINWPTGVSGCVYAPGTNTCVASGGGSTGGSVTYTASQTASSSDAGKLVIMNCSSACAYTLPATQPSTAWFAGVTSQGATLATVALGGSDTFNGSTSVPALNRYRILWVYANTATATDYRGDAPLMATSPLALTPGPNGLAIGCPTCGSGGGSAPLFGTNDPRGLSTPALIQNRAAANASTLATASNVAAGNVMIISFYAHNLTASTVTATDSLGTTYVKLGTYTGGSSDGLAVLAGVLPGGGAADTITVSNFGTDGHPNIGITEYSGLSTTLDGTAQQGTTGTNPTGTLALTTTSANDLLLSLEGDGSGNTTRTASSGWTTLSAVGLYWTLAYGYEVAGTSGSYSVYWNLNSAQTAITILLAIEPASTPVSGTEGQLYFRDSSSPYPAYVYHSGLWQPVN